MKFSSLALAAGLLGASLGSAFAEQNPNAAVVPVGQAQASSVVVEGRQAAPVAASSSLSGAERYIIDHEVTSQAN
jgi:hypothetical protein